MLELKARISTRGDSTKNLMSKMVGGFIHKYLIDLTSAVRSF